MWPVTLAGMSFASPRAMWAFCTVIQERAALDVDLPADQAAVLIQLLLVGPFSGSRPASEAASAAAASGAVLPVRVVMADPRATLDAASPSSGGDARSEEMTPRSRIFAVIRAGAAGEEVLPFSFHRAMGRLVLHSSLGRPVGNEQSDEALDSAPDSAETGSSAEQRDPNGGDARAPDSPPPPVQQVPIIQRASGKRPHKAVSGRIEGGAAPNSPTMAATAAAAAAGELEAQGAPAALTPLPAAAPLPVRPQPTQLSGWATQVPVLG
jgi:hypothetical protein